MQHGRVAQHSHCKNCEPFNIDRFAEFEPHNIAETKRPITEGIKDVRYAPACQKTRLGMAFHMQQSRVAQHPP